LYQNVLKGENAMKYMRPTIGTILVVLGILATQPLYASDPVQTPSPQANVVTAKKEIVEPVRPDVARINDAPPTLSLEQTQRLEDFRRNRRARPYQVPEGDPRVVRVQWDKMPPETRPDMQSVSKKRVPNNPGDFVIFQNSSVQSVIPTTNRAFVTEPTVANRRSVVFQTGNTYAVLSTDNGHTFRFFDPSTTFSQPTGGACCDQSVVYDPSRDLMLWIVLYFDNGTQNVLRLAVSRGNDIVSGRWSYYYDWWSPAGTFYDFPDMCLSNNRLWLTANTALLSNNTINNAYMRSISLDEIKAGTTLNTYVIDSSTNGWSNRFFRCTRGATNTMYWGSHNNTSQLRVFKWVEGAMSVSYADVNLSPSWNDLQRSCPGPDGRDWCGGVQGMILVVQPQNPAES
jgi:hypothetical protein